MKKSYTLALFCILLQFNYFSQNNTIDSLLTVIKTASQDTTKVNTYHQLFLQYEFDDAVKAKECLDKAFELAQTIKYKKGTATTYMYYGFFADDESDYSVALKNYNASLKIFEAIHHKKGMASSFNSIGSVFYAQGNYPMALQNHLAALKIREEIADKNGVASSYGNIGNVYNDQGDYPKALQNYFSCLKMMVEIGNKKAIATTYNNIALVYTEQHSYTEALQNHLASLKMRQELADEKGIASSYNNIGLVYFYQGNYAEAEKNYFLSLKMKEEIGDKALIAGQYCNIGEVFLKQKKHVQAKEYLTKAKQISQEIGYRENLRNIYSALAELDYNTQNFKSAYDNHRLFIRYRDSLNNEDTREKIIQNQMTYDFDKKEAIAIAEHKKELENQQALAEEKSHKQNLLILFVVIGLVLVLAFSVFIFRSLNLTQKQKKIIELQKDHSEHQRLMVEEKQKDIIDSINYAKRIQEALLKEEDHISEHLPEHFIVFKPKDIVSGDFYWAFEKNDYWYLAAADCTGHGVPGAFMSMLGIAFLNEISASVELLSPAQILDLLRDKIVKELGQNGKDGENKDGMDISLMRYHIKTKQLQWSGANNSLYIMRGNENAVTDLVEVKANKQPIGFHETMQPFTNHTFTLEKGNSIYLFTDGFADQFGGPKGKKFKYSKLKELLISINSQPMDKQKEVLHTEFETWKTNLEQTDDVCVIGVRV